MVEYNELAAAKHAKKALQDQDIYSDCCTIKVEYARTQKLNVYKVIHSNIKNDAILYKYRKIIKIVSIKN